MRIIRFHEYGPSYLLSAFACGVVAGFPPDANILPVLGFVGFSSIFGFTINDIADADLDKRAGKMRNPIAAGDLSLGSASILSTVLLAISVLLLYPLSLLNRVLGAAVILLFASYSLGLRAKARPGLDMAYHSSWPALYGIMAYTLYRPFDFLGFGLSSILFLLSFLAELVQEIRDYETDKLSIRTTVAIVGKSNALKMCIGILLTVLAVFLGLILAGSLPLLLVIYCPAISILITPFLNALRDHRREEELIPVLRSRGTAIGLFLVTTYILIRIVSTP